LCANTTAVALCRIAHRNTKRGSIKQALTVPFDTISLQIMPFFAVKQRTAKDSVSRLAIGAQASAAWAGVRIGRSAGVLYSKEACSITILIGQLPF
jgi:hypothetical protein